MRTGPASKLPQIEKAIMEMLQKSEARVSGMGFRQMHRRLNDNPDEAARPGSFSTLKKCLERLEAAGVVHRNPGTKKYFMDEICGDPHYDRGLVMEAILQANVSGGGRLYHPAVEFNDKIVIPKEPPKVFLAVDAFVEADLMGWEGWPDKGVLFIQTFDGIWPEPPRKKAKDTKTQREPLEFLGLVMRRLNPQRSAREWIEAIWNHAREAGLAEEDVPLERASTDDMDRIWSRMFARAKVKTIVLTEYIQPERLLDWWKASQNTITPNDRHIRTSKNKTR